MRILILLVMIAGAQAGIIEDLILTPFSWTENEINVRIEQHIYTEKRFDFKTGKVVQIFYLKGLYDKNRNKYANKAFILEILEKQKDPLPRSAVLTKYKLKEGLQ